ncbi:MAG: hypothetical protein ACYCWE_11910 [Eubacteriales bacterium]
MNFKYNLKYFTSKDWPVALGSAMMVIGLTPAVLQIMGIGMMVFTSFGIIMAFVGACIVVFTLGGKTSDIEFAEQIQRFTAGMQQSALKKLGFEEKHIKIYPLYDPYRFGEYDFSGSEDILVKRGKDGKIRSSIFSQTLLLFTAEKLCIYRQRFSFLNDYNEFFLDVIPYIDIDSVFITDGIYKTQFEKNNLTVKYVMFNLKNNEGAVISIPAHNDADLDKLVLSIMKLANQKKADSSKKQ